MNCFDFDDLDRVHLYDGETYLGTFDRITPAQQFGPNKDMRAVGKIKALNEKVNGHRAAKMTEIAANKEVCLNAIEEIIEAESVPGELGILQSGRIRKPDYEASETAWLREQWNTDEDEDITVNVRKQY